MCLVDTGADSSLFPRSIPAQVGHKLRGKGVRTTYSMGVGGATTVWLHTFALHLMHPSKVDTAVWKSAAQRIGCVDSDNIPALLGADDFLKHFRLTLDYRAETLTVAW
jgi:hypothetical protein